MRTIKIKRWSELPTKFTGIVEHLNGKHWYLNGDLHRETGPCTTCKDCLNGNFVLCTKLGPAIEYADGSKLWFLNGLRHREGGAAVEYTNGTKYWYLHGKFHREDGPALERPDGTKRWYLDGKEVKKESAELYYMLKHKRILNI